MVLPQISLFLEVATPSQRNCSSPAAVRRSTKEANLEKIKLDFFLNLVIQLNSEPNLL